MPSSSPPSSFDSIPPDAWSEPVDQAGALEELRRIVANTHALVVTSYADELVVSRAASTLTRRTERAVSLLRLLEELDQSDTSVPGDEVDAWFNDHTPILAPPRLADVCFAGVFELRRALSELQAAAGADARVMAIESGCRKLRRAARAVLRAQRTSLHPSGADDSAEIERDGDLESGLAVRRLYASFRRALRRSEGESPEQVLDAMRYASSALGSIIAAPEYFALRASDRALVRRLHARVLAWGRHDRAATVGLQVLEDVWTAADLLRGINLRQEVQAHDRALVAVLVAGEVADGPDFVTALAALHGLDDGLDQLLEDVRRGADPESASIRARAILVRFASAG